MVSLKEIVAGITGVAVAASSVVAEQASAAETKPVTAKITQTEVVAQDINPISRTEIMLGNLPLKGDGYVQWEHQKTSDLYKFRAQIVAASYGPFSIGASGQHIRPMKGNTHDDLGLLIRANKPKDSKNPAKIDVRYFPNQHTIDSNGFIAYGGLSADELTSYNYEKGTFWIRQGVEYSFMKNFRAGLELKISGNPNGTKIDYAGLRAKIAL
jgi:hypothetical protein